MKKASSCVALATSLVALTGCSQDSNDTKLDEQALIFSVTDIAGSSMTANGPIPGTLSSTLPPEPSALVIADRLMRCGENRLTIEALSHAQYVMVSSTPKNIELVRCVQAKLDFGFGAGVGPANDPDLRNSQPFKALHAKSN